MKIKVKREDFVVEEVLSVPLRERGDYEVYILHKEGTNTLDAVKDIAKRLGLNEKDISYCGLKDRHAIAKQHIAIPAGKGKEIKALNYRTEFAGYLDRPLAPSLIKENRFTVKVREVATPEELVIEEIEDVKRHGFPNYYDVQRFGSARHGKGFAAHKVVLKEYEDALKLLIAIPSAHDSSQVKRFRKCLKENWGRWESCLSLAPSSWERKVLELLSKRGTSRKALKTALTMVDERTKEFAVNAFQSFIWNQVVCRLVEEKIPEENMVRVRYPYGHFAFYRKVSWNPEYRELPFPSPRIKLPPNLKRLYDGVLKDMGIESLEHLRTTVKGWVFKSHRRTTKVIPDISHHREWDLEHPGKSIWTLKVSLPPGCYATILIKRVFWRELI